MKTGLSASRATFVGLVALLLPFTAAAQTRLYVQGPGDKYYPVVQMLHGQPCRVEDNHLIPMPDRKLVLGKADEYLPICLKVSGVETHSTGIMARDVWAHTSNTFQFSVTLEVPYLVEGVMVALVLEVEPQGKQISVHDVGRLEPGVARRLTFQVPLEGDHLAGKYSYHMLVGGEEVFTSELSESFRESVLAQMVARRVAEAKQASPAVFFAPEPVYPAGLFRSGIKGQAVVKTRITPRGEPLAPVVVSATQPAFGDAALAAVRLTRFLPRVVDGRALECEVSLPFDFAPPAGKE